MLRALGLDSDAGRRKLTNKRTRLKQFFFDNYPNFIKLCQQYQVPCPEDNNWVYKAFPKTESEEEESPVKMPPKFKTTVSNSKPKVLSSDGDILDDDYGNLECLIFNK